MRILVLGDLHSRSKWFSWLYWKISEFDLIAIPGDMLDIFQGNFDGQKQFVVKWFEIARERGKPLAWCSGNHEVTRWSRAEPDVEESFCWTDWLRFDSIVGDLETKAYTSAEGEPFLVTCLPHCELQTDAWVGAVEKVLAYASRERLRLGCPWMILSHEPPSWTTVATTGNGLQGNDFLRQWILDFDPDFVFSGHLHQSPFLSRFWDRIGRTFCINPGHVSNASFPTHVVIDTGTGIAVFHSKRSRLGNLRPFSTRQESSSFLPRPSIRR